jgi:hypothetical protein
VAEPPILLYESSTKPNLTRKITGVPVGAVLTIAAITLESGLVDAIWDGQTVSVFVQDLKARAI